jgi:hypothetical protein
MRRSTVLSLSLQSVETMEEVSEKGENYFHKVTSAEHYMVQLMTVLSLFKNVTLIL